MYKLLFSKFSLLFIVLFGVGFGMSGQISQLTMDQIRLKSPADTTRITEILKSVLAKSPGSPGECVDIIGRMFIDTPYVAHTLEVDSGMPEVLTISLGELDCTTFVETVAALARTVRQNRSSWRDFANNLAQIRYRGGNLNGYGSRLHYIADWVTDNNYRGNVKDASHLFPKVNYITKSINYMSANRDKYPALTDSVQYERIRSVEDGYRNHRFAYIKTSDLSSKATKAAFQPGDIVALTSNIKNLDVTHMGIVVFENGAPYLLHASSSHGKVMITSVPLDEFMRRNVNLTGLRVIRLID